MHYLEYRKSDTLRLDGASETEPQYGDNTNVALIPTTKIAHQVQAAPGPPPAPSSGLRPHSVRPRIGSVGRSHSPDALGQDEMGFGPYSLYSSSSWRSPKSVSTSSLTHRSFSSA
jgi:hypothetical protein